MFRLNVDFRTKIASGELLVTRGAVGNRPEMSVVVKGSCGAVQQFGRPVARGSTPRLLVKHVRHLPKQHIGPVIIEEEVEHSYCIRKTPFLLQKE